MEAEDIRFVMVLTTAIFLFGLLIVGVWIHFHNVADEYLLYLFGINITDIIISSILIWLFMYFIGSVLIELGGKWVKERKTLKK